MLKKKSNGDKLADAIRKRFENTGSKFRRIKFDLDKPVRVRLLGSYMEVGRHIFQIGQKWYYFVCWKTILKKDVETGELHPRKLIPKGGCAICNFMKKLEGNSDRKSLKVLDFLSDKRKNDQVFVWNCIDRKNPKNDEGKLSATELAHKWQVYKRVCEIQEDENNGKSVSHPKYGCDLKITLRKKKSRFEYSTSKLERTPLTEEELEMVMLDLSNMYGFKEEEAAEAVKLLSKKTSREFIEEDDDEVETDDEDLEDNDKPTKKIKKEKEVEDDEENDDEDEEEDEDLDEDLEE